MNHHLRNYRRRAAAMARLYFAGAISWEMFMDEYSAPSDRLVVELAHLVEHPPRPGIFFGTSSRKQKDYQNRVKVLIDELEMDEQP